MIRWWSSFTRSINESRLSEFSLTVYGSLMWYVQIEPTRRGLIVADLRALVLTKSLFAKRVAHGVFFGSLTLNKVHGGCIVDLIFLVNWVLNLVVDLQFHVDRICLKNSFTLYHVIQHGQLFDALSAILLCKAKRQYLLTCKVRRYCLFLRKATQKIETLKGNAKTPR